MKYAVPVKCKWRLEVAKNGYMNVDKNLIDKKNNQ